MKPKIKRMKINWNREIREAKWQLKQSRWTTKEEKMIETKVWKGLIRNTSSCNTNH